MERLESISPAQEKLIKELQRCVVRIRTLVEREVPSIDEGVAIIRQLRQEVYEDLNRIMHEGLILSAARWLEANVFSDPKTVWYWNPRQTGDSTESDLRCLHNGQILLSAEATASEEPKGILILGCATLSRS